jgi:hypothetical protein
MVFERKAKAHLEWTRRCKPISLLCMDDTARSQLLSLQFRLTVIIDEYEAELLVWEKS